MRKLYFTKEEVLAARRNRRNPRDILGRTQEQYKEKYIIKDVSGCWNWIGCKDRGGYGYVRIGKIQIGAHRYIYTLYKGEIGDKFVLHTCDNPSCVNPEHLFLGTQTDNMQDMISKGRHWKGYQNV